MKTEAPIRVTDSLTDPKGGEVSVLWKTHILFFSELKSSSFVLIFLTKINDFRMLFVIVKFLNVSYLFRNVILSSFAART